MSLMITNAKSHLTHLNMLLHHFKPTNLHRSIHYANQYLGCAEQRHIMSKENRKQENQNQLHLL